MEENKRPQSQRRTTTAGSGFGFTFAAFGVLLLVVTMVVLPVLKIDIGIGTTTILAMAGLVLLALGLFFMFLPKVFHKSSTDMALVRSGFGGSKAVIDGGVLVFPLLHNISAVSLRQQKMEVERSGSRDKAEALRTQEDVKVDVRAEFVIAVPPEPDRVIQANRRFGEKTMDTEALKLEIIELLDGDLRQVARDMGFVDLLNKREEFRQKVGDHVRESLGKMGLELVTVNVSSLRQTPITDYDPNDVQDAAARKFVTAITQENLLAVTKIEQLTKRQIAAEQLETTRTLATQAVQQVTAEAARDQEIRVTKAEREREANIRAAELEQEVGVARAQSQQAIQVADTEAAQALGVAQIQREAAEQAAGVGKERTVEVANRERLIAVAEAEQRLAVAEAQRLLALAEQTTADQKVKTAISNAEADRAANTITIQVTAKASQDLVTAQQGAEADAFKIERAARASQQAADANAAAIQTAASAQAAKIRLEAEAERDAAVARATGQQAEQMIPVEVNRKSVEVARDQLGVDVDRMEAQTTNADAIAKIELGRAQIEADRDVRIAEATARGQALSSANIRIVGTADDARELLGGMQKAQAVTAAGQSFFETLPDDVRAMIPVIVGMVVEKMSSNGHSNGNAMAEVENTTSTAA